MLAQNHGAVHHVRSRHVINKRALAERLFKAPIARWGIADSVSVSVALTISVAVLAVSELRIAAHAVILAKIGMAARLITRKLSAVFPGFACGLYGVNNPCISRAAAEMTS